MDFNITSETRLPSPITLASGLRHPQVFQHLDDALAFAMSWAVHKESILAGVREDLDSINSMELADFRTRNLLRSRVEDIVNRLEFSSAILDAFLDAVGTGSGVLRTDNRPCGIMSLPEEILNTIFDLVVNNSAMSASTLIFPREWRAAVRLSHVNQHFRTIMLSCPRHWTHIHSSSKMASACLPRTNGLPLSISLEAFDIDDDDDDDGWLLEPLLLEVLPFSHRWNSLNIILKTSSSRIPKQRLIKEHELRRLDLTSLIHLEFHQDLFCSDFELSPWDWSHWTTPNLQSLTAEYYFPHSFPGFANVTQLHLTLQMNDSSIADTLKDISKMGRLQDLTLSFENASELDGTLLRYRKREFPQVRRLKILLEQHLPNDQYTPALVRSLFSSLYFPSVEELVVELIGNASFFDFKDDVREEEWTDNFYFNKDIHRLFRHVEQFPNVSSFHLKVISAFGNYYTDGGWTELCIPLNVLPSIKHFTLESNTLLDIKEPESPDEINFESERRVPSRVVGEKVPELETVTLDMLDPSAAAEWLGEYLGELKDSGELTGFRELILIEKIGKFNRRRVSYSGEEALEWCGTV
ncbi:hypothetical protein SCHPADRAFT_268610 [Schizopora paradoxa]|uniref:F-box domain-containing protein n=1 Tax=Schizopora paradoxa TaxID=27342 RepID=A0A0H2RTW7_9AGAM|nr:hypothetical protein SCHPADRAFT_268610 [Schizopora paradoxa]